MVDNDTEPDCTFSLRPALKSSTKPRIRCCVEGWLSQNMNKSSSLILAPAISCRLARAAGAEREESLWGLSMRSSCVAMMVWIQQHLNTIYYNEWLQRVQIGNSVWWPYQRVTLGTTKRKGIMAVCLSSRLRHLKCNKEIKYNHKEGCTSFMLNRNFMVL